MVLRDEPLIKIKSLIYKGEHKMNLLNITKQEKDELFNELITPLKAKLYKTGMAILKNDDDVCDALQEALISGYKNLEKLEKEEFFSTWMIRIMINKCYDIIKNNKKIININQKLENYHENEYYYDRYKEESDVEKALNSINEELRLIVVLYYYNDFSVKEIAEICNIPQGTVKSRLARAREKIYTILKKEGEDSEQ
ncbi:MAG: RNA polymerase sigma factor [Clostridia bacterium]|nr:RNA polymerase sigma factor [Clostridia bacterium]